MKEKDVIKEDPPSLVAVAEKMAGILGITAPRGSEVTSWVPPVPFLPSLAYFLQHKGKGRALCGDCEDGGW